MPNAQSGMEFSTARSVIGEVIRQQRGMQKLHEVLEAATRAEGALRSLPGEIKGLEKERDKLKIAVKEAQVKVQTAGNEWADKTASAKTSHQDFVKESAKTERQLNKKYKDMKIELEERHRINKEDLSKEIADTKRDLVSLKRDRDEVQNELNELSGKLSLLMKRFSGS